MTERLEDWQRQQLVERIKKGAVFIYPTDTGYGLGCSIYCSEAIEAIFKIKGRESSKTVPVLLNSAAVSGLAELCEEEKKAIEKFWPGALTLVLKAKEPEKLDPRIVRDGSVALREPGLPELVVLLNGAGPIVGTSANIAGQPMPHRVEDVHPQLVREVDFVLGGAVGEGESSTVAAWNPEKNEWVIHREGPVSKEELPD